VKQLTPTEEAEVLIIAKRERLDPERLRLEYRISHYGSGYHPTVEAAAAALKQSNRNIRAVAEGQAEYWMNNLKALEAEFNISRWAILEEKRTGEWPTERAAAEHLAELARQKTSIPPPHQKSSGTLRRVLNFFRRQP